MSLKKTCSNSCNDKGNPSVKKWLGLPHLLPIQKENEMRAKTFYKETECSYPTDSFRNLQTHYRNI